MPNRDGTGPYGDGRPGWGFGPCGRGRAFGFGNGRRGMGFRWGWRANAYNEPVNDGSVYQYNKENLLARKSELEQQVNWINKELDNLKEDKTK